MFIEIWIEGDMMTMSHSHYKCSIGKGLVETMFDYFLSILRGHLGVPDTVSEPRIAPLKYLVILHLIHLKAQDFRN